MIARLGLCAVLFSTVFQLACASRGTSTGPEQVSVTLADRIGADPRPLDRAPGSLPPDVQLTDGFTMQEAVATALWNNPAFQLALTDLGVARADVIDAGLLRNPILSILFPWGPKQLEATANWAIDSIWQRPRRLAAARLDLQSVAARLVHDGIALMGTVRGAYIHAVASMRRAQVTRENAEVVRRFGDIIEARLRGGEISELEARATRDDRLIVEAIAKTAEHDQALALIRLKALVGLAQNASLTLTPFADLTIQSCGEPATLIKDALAARPDVRAAELGIEAAGARAGLARAQVIALTAILDANAEGSEGFELGPGVSVELPLFSRNTGGRARATAALQQAQTRYLAVRAQVDEEVHTALALLARARDVVALWEGETLESVGIEQRQAQLAYEAGELQLLAVLDANRRFGVIRLGALDARRELLTAAAALDQAVGRSCTLK